MERRAPVGGRRCTSLRTPMRLSPRRAELAVARNGAGTDPAVPDERPAVGVDDHRAADPIDAALDTYPVAGGNEDAVGRQRRPVP